MCEVKTKYRWLAANLLFAEVSFEAGLVFLRLSLAVPKPKKMLWDPKRAFRAHQMSTFSLQTVCFLGSSIGKASTKQGRAL